MKSKVIRVPGPLIAAVETLVKNYHLDMGRRQIERLERLDALSPDDWKKWQLNEPRPE